MKLEKGDIVFIYGSTDESMMKVREKKKKKKKNKKTKTKREIDHFD